MARRRQADRWWERDDVAAWGGPRAQVCFEVTEVLESGYDETWQELVDWEAHGNWVPMTEVAVHTSGPDRFTAWTGVGPLALEDRMEVLEVDRDDTSGRCEVRKLGPVLVGRAVLTVERAGDGCRVTWYEQVTVPWLPKVLAPLVVKMSAKAFGSSLRKMERQVLERQELGGRQSASR